MLSRIPKRSEDRTVGSSGGDRRSSTSSLIHRRSVTPVDQSEISQKTRSTSLDRGSDCAGNPTNQRHFREADESQKETEIKRKQAEIPENDYPQADEDRLIESQCSNEIKDNQVITDISSSQRAVLPLNVQQDQTCLNKNSKSNALEPVVPSTASSPLSSLSPNQPMSSTSVPILPSIVSPSVPVSSMCVTCTGESSYELSSIDSGVCITHQPMGGGSLPTIQKSIFFSKETQTEDREHRVSTSAQGTQTSEWYSSMGGDFTIGYAHPQQHLQPRLEALSLSNELLKTSLEDARRQVASLQTTVESQREEIVGKETQINTINRRISSLLRGFESTESNTMHYKDLYHKSVQQNGILQEQINQFRKMFVGIQKFPNFFEVLAKQLQCNKTMLDSWKRDIKEREGECLKKVREMSVLKTVHEEMMEDSRKLQLLNRSLQCSHEVQIVQLAKEMTRASITSARFRLSFQEARETEECLMIHNHDLQGKLAHLLDSFKHAKDEFQENSEFSAMEREMLLETNMELEQEVKKLKDEIQQGEEEFQKLVNYIKQYQEESTEKTDILKANLAKADKEIEELDKLVEQIRMVMRDNLSCINQSKPLMCMYQQLNGEEVTS